ncbi:hypothetical protein [Kineococcus sp. SYSU DK006]|uniref:hypothetical protein n=1 Tax=Kineococcus sp. SYSU DK006 TaxID=3383127 RepID=UPI003D7E46F3
MHLDEVLSSALETVPERRHVVLSPRLAVLSDPRMVDEEDPPMPALPDLPPGEYGWYAYAPLSGQSLSSNAAQQQQGREELGDDDQESREPWARVASFC